MMVLWPENWKDFKISLPKLFIENKSTFKVRLSHHISLKNSIQFWLAGQSNLWIDFYALVKWEWLTLKVGTLKITLKKLIYFFPLIKPFIRGQTSWDQCSYIFHTWKLNNSYCIMKARLIIIIFFTPFLHISSFLQIRYKKLLRVTAEAWTQFNQCYYWIHQSSRGLWTFKSLESFFFSNIRILKIQMQPLKGSEPNILGLILIAWH